MNQKKALVGAFSVIVKTDCESDGLFYITNRDSGGGGGDNGHYHPHYRDQDSWAGQSSILGRLQSMTTGGYFSITWD